MNLTRREAIALVGSAIGCAAIRIPAAYGEEPQEDAVLLTESMAYEKSVDFAQSMVPDMMLTPSAITKIYDMSCQAIGYIVNYSDPNGGASGYVVFDNSHESLVSEFSFDKGALSPYDATRINIAGLHSKSAGDFRAVKTAPFEYAVIDADSGEFFDKNGSTISEGSLEIASIFSAPSTGSWDDVFLCSMGDTRYTVVSQRNLPEFVAIDESWVEREAGRYACGVSAMLNCAAILLGASFSWSDIGNEYIDLWNLSETFVTSVSGGISYGSTYIDKYGPALQSYCSSRGKSIGYSRVTSPSFSQFSNAINRGDPAIFSTSINLSSGESGHAMTVEGYATLKLASGISDNLYSLIVCDGWQSNARHLNYYYTGFNYTHGTFYTS